MLTAHSTAGVVDCLVHTHFSGEETEVRRRQGDSKSLRVLKPGLVPNIMLPAKCFEELGFLW